MDEKPKRFALLRFSLMSLLAFVTVCAIVLGVIRPWKPLPPSPRNYNMVRAGMSYRQVEALLGRPTDLVFAPKEVLRYFPRDAAPEILDISVVMEDGRVIETQVLRVAGMRRGRTQYIETSTGR